MKDSMTDERQMHAKEEENLQQSRFTHMTVVGHDHVNSFLEQQEHVHSNSYSNSQVPDLCS